MTAQPTTPTVLFDQANVQALMFLGKAPRFEIHAPGREAEIIPATRSWKAEQKLAVERAQALVAGMADVRVAELLTAAGLALLAQGEKPTKKAAVLSVALEADGAVRITVAGGQNAQARADLRSAAADALAAAGWGTTPVQDGLVVVELGAAMPTDEPAVSEEVEAA
jgi:hypothetical protein